ncbi:TIGR04255 family protein [Salinimicrobium sp. CDJ15-81-2]|nr:TIGR04255 family protein [Salinimicrobium nanhaiense]
MDLGSLVEKGMKLPKRIDPCPIVDALVEIRFSTKINSNAVFGLIYNSLQPEFESVENLPIQQLPEPVRSSDPNLRFKPHYRVKSENFIVQIGPDVLTISSHPNYLGWTRFSEEIYRILSKVEQVGIINKVSRIGIRYINFFQEDVFKLVNLNVNLGEKPVKYNNTVVRTEFDQGDFRSTLQIANNANMNGKSGSIIDIDTFISFDTNNFFEKKEDLINTGHQKEKELFFSLLKEDFLKTLKPIY